MPKKKIEIVPAKPTGEPMAPVGEDIGIVKPMSRADVDLESTPKPEVSEAPGLPRIIGGVCEFCGTGIECIHYPELNGITE